MYDAHKPLWLTLITANNAFCNAANSHITASNITHSWHGTILLYEGNIQENIISPDRLF